MSKQHVLAIDQGTTGTTAIVFDRDARIAGRAYSEFEQHYPRPGWVEHDPEEIWRVSVGVAGEAIAAAGLTAGDVAGIGITNQRETVVAWDRSGGEPLAPAIVWQDRRTAGMCDRLREQGHEDVVRARTGLVLDPYFSATKIAWLLDRGGLEDRAEAGELAIGTIDSWLIHRLTGGRTHVTDVTNASRTLLFDIHERRWDEGLLELFGVPAAVLPEVRPSSGVVAETDPECFLGARVPIAGIAGDQQAALFAQGCHERGMAKNTYGTGSFVLMNAGPVAVRSEHGLLTTVACGLEDDPATYALEGSIFVTGAAVQWLRDMLGIVDAAAQTEDLARSVAGNDDVYFVPALTGLGAPHWDPYARGTIVGLTRGTRRAHLARAALEAIAYQTRDVTMAMERDAGIAVRELRADGGAVTNGFLMQFQADVLQVPVQVPEVTETTALGSAFLAGIATGLWSGRDEVASLWRPARRFEPALDPGEAERLYRRWLQAVDRARSWSESEP